MADTFNLQNAPELSQAIVNAPPVPAEATGIPAGLPPLGVPVPQVVPAPALYVPPAQAEPVPGQAGPVPPPATPPVAPHPAPAAPVPVSPDLAQLRADTTETRKTAEELNKATTENEQAKTQNLEAQAEEKRRQAAELLQAQQDQARARQDSQDRISKALNTAKTEPYHSFFEDSAGNDSVGRRILAGLAVLAGGVSYSANHQNQAAQIIQQNIRQDFEKQREKHAELWKAVEEANQQGRDLSHEQLQQMADIRTRQAAQLNAVIDQGLKLAGPSQARRDALETKLKASGIIDARDQAVTEATRLQQAQIETARHNRAQEGIERERVAVERTKANASAGDAQVIKVTNLINASLKNKEIPDLIKKRDTLESVVSGIESGNPIAKGAALDEYTKAITGLGARPQAVKMFEQRAGGTFQQVLGIVQKAQNGDPLTPAETKRFLDAGKFALKETKDKLSTDKSNRRTALSKNPVIGKNKDALDAALDNIYGPDEAPAETFIVNPQTKQRLVLRNGQWVPAQ